MRVNDTRRNREIWQVLTPCKCEVESSGGRLRVVGVAPPPSTARLSRNAHAYTTTACFPRDLVQLYAATTAVMSN